MAEEMRSQKGARRGRRRSSRSCQNRRLMAQNVRVERSRTVVVRRQKDPPLLVPSPAISLPSLSRSFAGTSLDSSPPSLVLPRCASRWIWG
ncbi:UNVERIFIED_CONTAM: hypothetical protein Sangu_0191900 [Sesamum angustifolium]|uniref:Uncharacterized protein n=1 Tax=Sesamum angustifolium TaxID=2727405 RepID=A0AAW2RM71_9LAMI